MENKKYLVETKKENNKYLRCKEFVPTVRPDVRFNNWKLG